MGKGKRKEEGEEEGGSGEYKELAHKKRANGENHCHPSPVQLSR